MKFSFLISQFIAFTLSSTCFVYGQTNTVGSDVSRDPRPLKNPKMQAQYRDRFALFNKQIDEALASRKVTQDEAMSYKTRVYLMQRLAVHADRHSYEVKDVAHLHKLVSKFQNEWSAIEARKPSVTPEK